jgi:hypothetical protein
VTAGADLDADGANVVRVGGTARSLKIRIALTVSSSDASGPEMALADDSSLVAPAATHCEQGHRSGAFLLDN